MTKSDFEELLIDQGYELDRRLGGEYWTKDYYPTYKVETNWVMVLGYTSGEEKKGYYLNDEYQDGGLSE